MNYEIIVSEMCPNKICKNNAYSEYFLDYLVNSIYKQDYFNNFVRFIPSDISFLFGEDLFGVISAVVDSKRKYDSFINLSEIDQSINYKPQIDMYKRIFNSQLENINGLIEARRLEFTNLITKINELVSIKNLDNPNISYPIEDNIDFQNKITFIVSIITRNQNHFENSLTHYLKYIDPTPIA